MKSDKDDEYFCHRILVRQDIGHRPDVEALQPAILRALANPKKRGYRKEFHASLSLVQLRTVAGLHLGRLPTYTVENERMDIVASRIVRGLFFQHKNRRLPHTCFAHAWTMDGFTRDAAAAIQREFVDRLLDVPEQVIGDHVFGYRFLDLQDSPNTTACLMRFFEKVDFFGFTSCANKDRVGE